MDIQERLRERIRGLLSDGVVSHFIAYTAPSLPYMSRPTIIRSAADADKVVWNSFCVINLSNYIPQLVKEKSGKKIGVVATGCWSRNIVVQIQENQIKRDDVYIIGISSRGMINPKSILGRFPDEEIIEIHEDKHSITVTTTKRKEIINRWDLVRANCKTCSTPDPVIYDEVIGQLSGGRSISDPYHEVERIESMTTDERWEWFCQEIDGCIRCYACRNSCPLCYCPTCFVDDSRPQWLGKSTKATETRIFHILRAYHCAGRCTDCGTCESVCPMGINMRILTKKLEKDVLKLFKQKAGMDLSTPLPLTTYDLNDNEDFIFKP